MAFGTLEVTFTANGEDHDFTIAGLENDESGNEGSGTGNTTLLLLILAGGAAAAAQYFL